MVVGSGMWTRLCGLWLICVFQLIVWLAALWLHSLVVLPWPSQLKCTCCLSPFLMHLPLPHTVLNAILHRADYPPFPLYFLTQSTDLLYAGFFWPYTQTLFWVHSQRSHCLPTFPIHVLLKNNNYGLLLLDQKEVNAPSHLYGSGPQEPLHYDKRTSLESTLMT